MEPGMKEGMELGLEGEVRGTCIQSIRTPGHSHLLIEAIFINRTLSNAIYISVLS